MIFKFLITSTHPISESSATLQYFMFCFRRRKKEIKAQCIKCRYCEKILKGKKEINAHAKHHHKIPENVILESILLGFFLFLFLFEFISFQYLIVLILFFNCSHWRLEVRARVPQVPRYTDVRYAKISFRRERNVMFIDILNMDKRDTERALYLQISPIRNFKIYFKPIANLFSKTTRMMMYNLPSIPRFKMMCLFRRSFTKQNRFLTNNI